MLGEKDMFFGKRKDRNWLYYIVILLICGMCIIPSLSTSFHVNRQTKNDFTLILNCENTQGFITHFGHINCGPLANHDVTDAVSLTQQYQTTGFDMVRTHDFYGPTDISTIFPDMSKDPRNESAYNFTASDRYVSAIVDAGGKVFYRLGESASGDERLRTPPENFSRWAEVCKHIVMHYNDGWADGFQYDITYWEVWNEPDLSGFWSGSVQQYYELFEITANRLKSYDPQLKIGGPCTSSITNENFTTGFLSFVKQHQVPLDFYSWHMYTDSAYDLYEGSRQMRLLLDSYGFVDTENMNTEWNNNILSPQRDHDNAKNAAFTACALSAFQDAGIDYAFRYRGTQDNNDFSRFIGFDLSLFTYDGLYKTPALSYLAFHHMVKNTPIRLQSPVIDAKDQFTCLAGIAEDGSNITLLLSNIDNHEISFNITIDQLPWHTSCEVIEYGIDEDLHFQIIDQSTHQNSSINLRNNLEPSSVRFIRLTHGSVFPEEGPVPAEIPLFLRLRIFDPIAKILGFILLLIIFS